ncbi:DUF5958 family protein [Streptomyces sp. NPDC005181]|uniref:DUF5958 family protein n=1 Tax=Streptomyces sp. NPDC005181 TaxID=3156869 RepID=UPI0033BDAF4A
MTERDVILNELAQELRPTHTPAVLITRGRIDQQLGKIACLTPPDERRKEFRLLIAILAIADERRRERFCSDGCSTRWNWAASRTSGSCGSAPPGT